MIRTQSCKNRKTQGCIKFILLINRCSFTRCMRGDSRYTTTSNTIYIYAITMATIYTYKHLFLIRAASGQHSTNMSHALTFDLAKTTVMDSGSPLCKCMCQFELCASLWMYTYELDTLKRVRVVVTRALVSELASRSRTA